MVEDTKGISYNNVFIGKLRQQNMEIHLVLFNSNLGNSIEIGLWMVVFIE